jgi:peptidyl-prolyl cis-trans isomerase D
MTAAQFEDSLRRALTVEKLRASLTDWMSVPDKELEEEYRRRNEKVKLAVVTFPADRFRSEVTASDDEIAKHFDAKKTDFTVGEKRKVRYAVLDIDALRSKIVIPPADIERAYNENMDQYSTPEQIRASHILFKTEGKDEAAVRAQAEEVLKQAKAGADFAALATKFSEDESNAKNGGDLDFFGRGRMVPEFDQAAFALKPGDISELVKTDFGFHIIKVVEKQGGISKTLNDVRAQITDQLLFERAQAQAADLAQKLEPQVKTPADLDRVAQANGLTVQESNFFGRDEVNFGAGPSPEAANRIFELQQDAVAGPIQAARGFVFVHYLAKQDPYVPQLAEVKERVREEVIKQKALDLSKQRAVEIGARLKTAADFEGTAKAAKLEPKTTELIARGSPIPDLGVAPAVEDVAFALPVGGVTDPITTDTGTAVVKVLEKQEVTPTELASSKDRFREELLVDRRNRFFSAYMQKAKEKMRIEINRETVQRVVG